MQLTTQRPTSAPHLEIHNCPHAPERMSAFVMLMSFHPTATPSLPSQGGLTHNLSRCVTASCRSNRKLIRSHEKQMDRTTHNHHRTSLLTLNPLSAAISHTRPNRAKLAPALTCHHTEPGIFPTHAVHVRFMKHCNSCGSVPISFSALRNHAKASNMLDRSYRGDRFLSHRPAGGHPSAHKRL